MRLAPERVGAAAVLLAVLIGACFVVVNRCAEERGRQHAQIAHEIEDRMQLAEQTEQAAKDAKKSADEFRQSRRAFDNRVAGNRARLFNHRRKGIGDPTPEHLRDRFVALGYTSATLRGR